MSNAFTDFISWSSSPPTDPAVVTAGAHTSRAGTGITQTLLDMIDAQQPVTTTQLSEQAGIGTKIVWGLMKNHLKSGRVKHDISHGWTGRALKGREA